MVLGKLIESESFGEINTFRYFEDLPEIESYIKFSPALESVKKVQYGSPENPKRFLPRDIKQEIEKLLKQDISSDFKVYFYTAVGSHLDRWHGIDAFFEIIEENKNSVIVTLDVTSNPNKDSYKADVIITVSRDGIDPGDADYREHIEEYAKLIESEYLTKIGNQGIKHYKAA